MKEERLESHRLEESRSDHLLLLRHHCLQLVLFCVVLSERIESIDIFSHDVTLRVRMYVSPFEPRSFLITFQFANPE